MAERVEKEASRKRKYESEKEEQEKAQQSAWSRLENHLGEEANLDDAEEEEDKNKSCEKIGLFGGYVWLFWGCGGGP